LHIYLITSFLSIKCTQVRILPSLLIQRNFVIYIFSWIKQHEKHNGELLFCTLPSLNKHIKLDQTPQIKRGKWCKVVTKGQESPKVPKDPKKCVVWQILRRNRKEIFVSILVANERTIIVQLVKALLWATLRSSHANITTPLPPIPLHESNPFTPKP